MNTVSNKRPLTIVFNSIAIAYLFFVAFVEYLFDPRSDEHVPWDSVFEAWPLVGIVGMVLFVTLIIAGGALLLREFWNRFLVDVFDIRTVCFREAMAILLIIGIFAWH